MGSTDIMSGSEEKTQNASPEQGTETQDKPGAIYRYFKPFPARPEKVFNIDHNGQVKMGLLLNMQDFDREIISPLPWEMYPQHLYFGDLIWPSHRDMTNGEYMSHISRHINETYIFIHQALLRVKAIETNYMRYWWDLAIKEHPGWENILDEKSKAPETLPVEKSELCGPDKLIVQEYEEDKGISEEEDIEQEGTSEEDEDERDLKSYWIQKVNCSWIEIIHLF